jgi:hypothetical protein
MKPSPQSNDGMHPTADTNDVIYHLRCRAAGDAGRYAVSEYSQILYISLSYDYS